MKKFSIDKEDYSKPFFHFDLDGTLADTFELNLRAYKFAVESVGGNWSQTATEMLLSGAQASNFLHDCRNLPRQRFPEVQSIKREYFLRNLQVIKPISEGMELLSSAGELAALVTNSSKVNAMAVLKCLRIQDKFSHVITGADVKNHKPHPEPYLLSISMAEKKYLTKLTHIAVEDSEMGKTSALEAGLKIISFGRPCNTENS
jgi:beta-phosphoglucomutase-like phosphatase (HAD superfamily)